MAGGLKIGFQNRVVPGMQLSCHHNLAPAGDVHGHQDRFSKSGCPVVHGRIGDIHLIETTDKALVFIDGLQGSL